MEKWILGLIATQKYFRHVIEQAKKFPMEGDDAYIITLAAEIERIERELRSVLA